MRARAAHSCRTFWRRRTIPATGAEASNIRDRETAASGGSLRGALHQLTSPDHHDDGGGDGDDSGNCGGGDRVMGMMMMMMIGMVRVRVIGNWGCGHSRAGEDA